MSQGWDESAAAWIAALGERGDYSRAHVLDAPMLARARAGGFADALDVGCGEGRFCRMLAEAGIKTAGIDPTQALVDRARACDPGGDYRLGRAEALDFADGAFDLVVSYLSLVDIADMRQAIAEMARVLRPGGALLIANLTSFATASAVPGGGWTREDGRPPRFVIDNYLTERGEWSSWDGIRIVNWHRPLGAYMSALLEQGLVLRHFSEPAPSGGGSERVARYNRVPYLMMMEWEKPNR